MDKRKEFQKMRNHFFNQFERKECGNCGSEKDLTIHHVVPLAKGGNNVMTNLAMLCEHCHGLIHGEDFVSFRRLQREGKERAKQRPDFKEGRPRKYGNKQIDHAMKLLETNSYKEVERMTGISVPTLSRYKAKRKAVD